MNWNIRYASDSDSFTEDYDSAVKGLGALLNKKQIKYNQRINFNPADGNYLGEGWSTPVPIGKVPGAERQGWTHTSIRPKQVDWERAKSLKPGDFGWESIAKDVSYDQQCEPTPETADAYNEIKKGVDTYGSPKEGGGWNMPEPLHPAVREVLSTIQQEVSSSKGGSPLLHHTIINAPKDSVPELHRGISFTLPTDKTPGHQTIIPGLQKGAENIEANHQAILDYLKPGATMDEGIKSWSADPDIAKVFAYREGARGTGGTGGSIQAIFHLPKRSSSLQISALGQTSAFQEEYLHAGGPLEVTKHTIDDEGIHHIHLKEQNPNTESSQGVIKSETPGSSGTSSEVTQPKVEKTPEVTTSVRENTGAGLLLGRPTIPKVIATLKESKGPTIKKSNWNERYASEKRAIDLGGIIHALPAIGHGIAQTARGLSKVIWPEGTKTMGSDVATTLKIMSDPNKRQETLDKIKHPGQTIGIGTRMMVDDVKDKVKSLLNSGEDKEEEE